MNAYPPDVADLLARGAEVAWYPLVDDAGSVVGAVIVGVAWPLQWDASRFRNPLTGRDGIAAASGQCVPRRRDACPCGLPRPGPAVSPVCPQAP